MEAVIVDGANVVGSRPDGWWRDRAGAARRLHERLSATQWPQDEIILVLEGDARAGVPAGQQGAVRTVHAEGAGDDAIVEEANKQLAAGAGQSVIVVTADRLLREQVEAAGASTRSPTWLLDRL
jgi:predicted RNA-binding protein with PIN domain